MGEVVLRGSLSRALHWYYAARLDSFVGRRSAGKDLEWLFFRWRVISGCPRE
jgi:hypothetical protein